MSVIAGPTTGAERHTATPSRWTGRPRVARALRIAIIIAPLIASVFYTWLAGRLFPAEKLGLGRWTWIGLVFLTANLLLVVLRRLTARLLPLVALMKLTLVFPDQAPSRMRATLRKSNSRKMLRQITDARARGEHSDEISHGDYLMQLLLDVNEHDRLTRGHSERVRVYSEMLGEEIGLGNDDMNKLRWAALLHDVGKLSVPSEILNSPNRPSEEEWKILSGHPAAAIPLLEPLRPWLGDWLHSADQHHCRWDGAGYPSDLAGTDISLAGRLVAIADAYDVMTSARSYKKPLSVEMARQELTRCAGSQFDPALVRAFLRISLGRLRTVGGPLAWLANLTGSAQLPVPVASTVTATTWSSGIAAVGMSAAAVTGLVTPVSEAPEVLAFAEPTVVAYDQSVSVRENSSLVLWLGTSSSTGSPTVVVRDPRAGIVEASTRPEPADPPLAGAALDDAYWQTAATYTPQPGFFGQDAFEFEACLGEDICSTGQVTIDVLSTNEGPLSSPDEAQTSSGQPVVIDALDNDSDPDGDTLTLASADDATRGIVRIVDNQLEYTSDPAFEGTDTFVYTATDPEGASATAVVTVTVRRPVVEPTIPVVSDDEGPGFETIEDAGFTTAVVTSNDGIADDDRYIVEILSGTTNGILTNNEDGTFDYQPDPDFYGTDSFRYVLIASDGELSDPATVTISVFAIADAPIANDDFGGQFEVTEDGTLTTPDVTINDTDADGELQFVAISVTQPPKNGTVIAGGDGTFTYTPNPDFSGTDSFGYQLIDTDGLRSDTGLVTLTVGAINDEPVAMPDGGEGFRTTEDAALLLPSLAINDSDVEDDVVLDESVTVVDGVQHGTLVVTDSGTLRYTPDANFFGVDTFTYTITDSDGLISAPAVVTIEINSVNDTPIAVADSGAGYRTLEDEALTTIDVTANDSDLEDGAARRTSVQVATGTTNGTLTNNGDGTFDYVPAPNFSGTDTFTYTITDDDGTTSAPAIVSLVIAPVNDAPVAIDDSGAGFTTAEDTIFTTTTVIANDADIDGDVVNQRSVSTVEDAQHGTLTNNNDGTFTYTPTPDFNGTDTFTYTITDADDTTSQPATVTITVTPVNDAPIAIDDTATTAEDTTITITDLTANDFDTEDSVIDATTITVTTTTTTTNGTLTNNNDGTFTYTPTPDFAGTDIFTYTITDTEGLRSQPATVTITVTPVNDAPIAIDDAGIGFTTTEDATLTTASILANDTDTEDSVIDPGSVQVLNDVAHGTLAFNADGTFNYIPNTEFNGTDSFIYSITDSNGLGSAPATVSITVTPVNDAPIAIDDTATTAEDTTITFTDLTANDTDSEEGTANPTTATLATSPSNGTLTTNNDGTFTYTPAENYFGADTFTYTITDSNGLGSAPATVTITITPVNDAPIAIDDTGIGFITTEDTTLTTASVLENDFDTEDSTIDATTITVTTTTTNGTLTTNNDGTFTYEPTPDFNGTDTFTYTITDADDTTSQPATVTITVTPVNDAPIALDDTGPGFTANEDTTLTTASVLENDFDTEDGSIDATTITVTTTTNGTLTTNNDGTFTYTPTPDFNGTDTFTYTISDADDTTSLPATVTITITPVNDAPIATDDTGPGFTTTEDTTLTTASILANDTDTEDGTIDATTITVTTTTTNGTLTTNNDGTFTYTPTPDFAGTDTFTYTITDSDGLGSAPATVTITITPVNDAPIAIDDTGPGFTANEDTTLTTASVLENDFDTEDSVIDATTITVTNTTNGTLTNNNDGTFTYTPTPDFAGTDTFTYTITDSDGLGSAPATVTITVTPVNDAPIAIDDTGPGFTTNEDTTLTTASVLENDFDTEDSVIDATTITVTTTTTNGTLTTNNDGTFTYTPTPDFAGTDTFTYTITDSDGLGSAPATVTITITPVNDAPIATDDAGIGFTTTEDNTLTTASILANDTDTEDGPGVASFVVYDLTDLNGSLVNNFDGTFIYTPPANFNGTDTFTYTITDSDGLGSAPATVTITITPVNDAPIATDDAGIGFTTTEDNTLTTASILANDTDTEDGPGVASFVVYDLTDLNGSLVNNFDGTFIYTPPANFNGTDTFTYTMFDSDVAASNIATVTITVTNDNDAPLAIDDAGPGFTTEEDTPFTTASVTGNDSDLEDPVIDPSSIVVLTDPLHGALTSNGDGTFDYAPTSDFNGTDTFTYAVSDSGLLLSQPATVTIEVTPVNDPPEPSADSGTAFTALEDAVLLTPNVLDNDSDPKTERSTRPRS